MRLIFFSERLKFNVDSKKRKENGQNISGFLDNLIRIGNDKFCLLIRDYSQFAGNVLSTSAKISDLIKTSFFELNFAQNDEKLF